MGPSALSMLENEPTNKPTDVYIGCWARDLLYIVCLMSVMRYVSWVIWLNMDFKMNYRIGLDLIV